MGGAPRQVTPWQIEDLTPKEQQELLEQAVEESGDACQAADDAGWGDEPATREG